MTDFCRTTPDAGKTWLTTENCQVEELDSQNGNPTGNEVTVPVVWTENTTVTVQKSTYPNGAVYIQQTDDPALQSHLNQEVTYPTGTEGVGLQVAPPGADEIEANLVNEGPSPQNALQMVAAIFQWGPGL